MNANDYILHPSKPNFWVNLYKGKLQTLGQDSRIILDNPTLGSKYVIPCDEISNVFNLSDPSIDFWRMWLASISSQPHIFTIIPCQWLPDNKVLTKEEEGKLFAASKFYVTSVEDQSVDQYAEGLSSDGQKFWKISPGKGHFQWRRGTWQSEKVIAIGWEEVGNLKNFKTIDELRAKAKKEGISKAGYASDQLWSFKEVEEGDIMVSYGNYTILDIGIVNGPYFLSIDRFVKPYYDLYGHRKPVTWLKLGPVLIRNRKIARYMAQNNTIFQITNNDVVRFIQELLEKSYQFRIKEKVDNKLPKSRRLKISYEIDEDEIAKDIEAFSKVLSTTKEEKEIDVVEEFKNLKPQAAFNNIRTANQVRAQVIITGSAETDLEKKIVDDIEVYIPHGLDREMSERVEDLKVFHNLIVDIIDKMVPGLGKQVASISVENVTRDAYRYQGRIVFNFNRYLNECSRFFWFFIAARELAYLRHNRFDYKHNNLMRALLMEAYKKGF